MFAEGSAVRTTHGRTVIKTIVSALIKLKRGDLLPAGIHYWKMGSTGATQRDSHNRGTNR